MPEYILETKGITKRYGGILALSDVSMNFERGKIHALVGENGAGKSTLIRILSGIEPPTEGSIVFEGKTITDFKPYLAHEMGISTVYQEPVQVGLMSVEENIFMGRYQKNKYGLVDYKDLSERTESLMQRIGIQIDPKTTVKSLSVAKQQMVEILKAVSFNSKLIIFDEPTASLTIEETNNLKRIIRKLKEDGVTVIYISHRLEEIFDLCDTVSVLRDGKFVGKENVNEINTDILIRMMVGRELANIYPTREENYSSEDVLLKVHNIRNAKVHGVSFELRKGEILGFSGLVGAGRTELANAIFGIDEAEGSIELDGKEVIINTPADAISNGIGMVPENRKIEGLVQVLSVGDNMVLSTLKLLQKGVLMDHQKENGLIEEYIQKLSVKTPSKNQLVRNLSGGNQQKVVFAKWMCGNPKLIILDEPTQGVDVGAKAEIYDIILNIAQNGTGVMMISSELNELIAICDRIAIMCEGKLAGILNRNEFNEDLIMKYSIGEVAR